MVAEIFRYDCSHIMLSLNDDDDDAKALPTGVPKDDAMLWKWGVGGQNVSKSDDVILVCSLTEDPYIDYDPGRGLHPDDEELHWEWRAAVERRHPRVWVRLPVLNVVKSHLTMAVNSLWCFFLSAVKWFLCCLTIVNFGKNCKKNF